LRMTGEADVARSIRARAVSLLMMSARPPSALSLARCVQAILSKADKEWWDSLLADKGYKKFVKADWSRWVEEDDDAYTGHFPGMDFSAAGDWDDEPDSDDDVPLDDLDIGESSLPAEED